MRLRLDLAYDGSAFHGWARQPGLRTVQGELEQALATVLRTGAVAVTVAGRTDTGVHARGQVAHVDVDDDVLAASTGRSADQPVDALLRRLVGVMDADVRVRSVTQAPPGFDARFSAVWRRYVYRVVDHVSLVDPLVRSHVLVWPQALDVDAMNEAAELLLGAHDFAAFCRRRAGATTIRTLLELSWVRVQDGPERGTLEATVRADAFCHSMVRALVGCLLPVGEGRRPPAWAGEVLAAARRDPTVRVARAHGLTLEEVGYPPDARLAARAREARAVRTLPAT